MTFGADYFQTKTSSCETEKSLYLSRITVGNMTTCDTVCHGALAVVPLVVFTVSGTQLQDLFLDRL